MLCRGSKIIRFYANNFAKAADYSSVERGYAMKNGVKAAVLGVIVGTGVYACASMDSFAEKTFRGVSTVTMSQLSYRSAVTARGSIMQSDGKWYAAVAADESDARFIEEGQSAGVSGAAFDGTRNGIVRSVGSSARTLNGRTVVDVMIEITDCEKLKSGFTAESSIYTDDERTISTLPYEAIMQDEEGEYVFVFENSKAVRRNIETGLELSGGTEIKSGLTDGSEVISAPSELHENELVRKEN